MKKSKKFLSDNNDSKIETGEVSLKVKRLKEITKILNTNINDLLSENGMQISLPESSRASPEVPPTPPKQIPMILNLV